MSLTIYGVAASRTFRVLWAAEELGLPYEHVAYKFDGPDIKAPDYLAINPNARIPAIVDDGFALWESLAINLYLARKANRLWPRDVQGEALAWQWTLWAVADVESPLGQWTYNTLLLPPDQRSRDAADEGARKLAPKLDVLEATLGRRAWLADATFTIADLNLAAVLFRAKAFGLDRWPRIAGWYERCYARPAAQRAVALREDRQP